MKSKATISRDADLFRQELSNNRIFLAETLEESPGGKIEVRDIAKRAAEWRKKHGGPITESIHSIRRQMQVWGYDIQPDSHTWRPILCGYKFKEQP